MKPLQLRFVIGTNHALDEKPVDQPWVHKLRAVSFSHKKASVLKPTAHSLGRSDSAIARLQLLQSPRFSGKLIANFKSSEEQRSERRQDAESFPAQGLRTHQRTATTRSAPINIRGVLPPATDLTILGVYPAFACVVEVRAGRHTL